MDNRISLITAATIAGLCSTPLAAQAQEEEDDGALAGAYGRVNVGIQHVNDDGVGTYFNADEQLDEGMGLMDVDSRFGFKGDHELNDDLTALYQFEFAVDATSADIDDNDRLSWVGLEGDFGRLKAGRMWSSWYTYLGYNTDRSQFWGGPGYYGYPAFGFNAGMPTTRVSDTIQYTYGGGGYSTDPFTFTVETTMDADSACGTAKGSTVTVNANTFACNPSSNSTGATSDPANFDIVTLAGQGTVGNVSVNAALRQSQANFEEETAEPSQYGVGVRWNNGPLYIGGSYIATDQDTGQSGENPSMVEVLSTYDFGGGLSGQLSVSQLDNDMPNSQGDTTGFFALVSQNLTDKLNVYGEIQRLDVDGGNSGPDTSPQVILVGMGYSFP
jgi:predicted porin